MAKTSISRSDLKERVTLAIRQLPGCEGVKEISITSIVVLGHGPTWRASINDYGTAEFYAAYHAASRIAEEYGMLFELEEMKGR